MKSRRYCNDAERGDVWRDVIRNADRTEAMDFLKYLCQSCRITSWGTSWEYFRQYKQLFASVNGHYMDRNDGASHRPKGPDAVTRDRMRPRGA